jgi:hypothetical protein
MRFVFDTPPFINARQFTAAVLLQTQKEKIPPNTLCETKSGPFCTTFANQWREDSRSRYKRFRIKIFMRMAEKYRATISDHA